MIYKENDLQNKNKGRFTLKTIIKKVLDVSVYIFAVISNIVLIWIILSTLDISFTNTYEGSKNKNYNLFSLSQKINKNENYKGEIL